jgi:hypothetical protein
MSNSLGAGACRGRRPHHRDPTFKVGAGESRKEAEGGRCKRWAREEEEGTAGAWLSSRGVGVRVEVGVMMDLEGSELRLRFIRLSPPEGGRRVGEDKRRSLKAMPDSRLLPMLLLRLKKRGVGFMSQPSPFQVEGGGEGGGREEAGAPSGEEPLGADGGGMPHAAKAITRA